MSAAVSAVTFNGDTSYIELLVNTSVVPFGDTVSMEVRTRATLGRLMYIQLVDRAGRFADSMELKIADSNLEVLTKTQSSTASRRLCLLSFGMIESCRRSYKHIVWVSMYDDMMICFKGTVGMSLVPKWEGQIIDVFSMFRSSDAVHNTRQYVSRKGQHRSGFCQIWPKMYIELFTYLCRRIIKLAFYTHFNSAIKYFMS